MEHTILEVKGMAYFLKKSHYKKGVYLQIYESFYDPERKQTVHKSYRAIGYCHELQEKGIDDPIRHFSEEVDALNRERKRNKEPVREITDESPERCLGYFPFKNVHDAMSVKRYLDLLQTQTDFPFNVFSMFSSLVYARLVQPCSKRKTFHDVWPRLWETDPASLTQLYEGIAFLGDNYEKILEIYAHEVSRVFGYKTEQTYFDCTNFYFEIDREDEFRRKGPEKNNRRDPIVGLGLLLDANQVPLGMKMFPGNQSEVPVIRHVLSDLKQQHHIKGKTIRVADKGLNCAENIHHAIQHGDGYIHSKSIAKLPKTEKEWVLLTDGYKQVLDTNDKVKYFIKSCVAEFIYEYKDTSGVKQRFTVTEKRVVTLNPKLRTKKIAEIKKQVNKVKNLCLSQAKRKEYGDAAKYVNFEAIDEQGLTTDNRIEAALNQEAILQDIELAGFNLIVTSEIDMTPLDIYDAYHNLWRIEESFKVMKSQLDARPVYLQKQNTIIGHFLICYVAVLLLRLLQIHVFKNHYASEAIMDFARGFRLVNISPNKFINITKHAPFIDALAEKTGLPVKSYFLNNGQIKNMLNNRFKLKK
jgi:transposase